jgi:hypothetical protein
MREPSSGDGSFAIVKAVHEMSMRMGRSGLRTERAEPSDCQAWPLCDSGHNPAPLAEKRRPWDAGKVGVNPCTSNAHGRSSTDAPSGTSAAHTFLLLVRDKAND